MSIQLVRQIILEANIHGIECSEVEKDNFRVSRIHRDLGEVSIKDGNLRLTYFNMFEEPASAEWKTYFVSDFEIASKSMVDHIRHIIQLPEAVRDMQIHDAAENAEEYIFEFALIQNEANSRGSIVDGILVLSPADGQRYNEDIAALNRRFNR